MKESSRICYRLAVVVVLVFCLACPMPLRVWGQVIPPPEKTLAFHDLYTPVVLTVTLIRTNFAGSGKQITPTRGSGSTYVEDTQSRERITISWSTNASDDWLIELSINYTVPTKQIIWYSTQAYDSVGLPLNAGPLPYMSEDQYVSLFFTVTTRASPRYPTVQEQMSWMTQPGNPLIRAIDRNTEAIVGTPTEPGLFDKISFLEGLLWMLIVLVGLVGLGLLVLVRRLGSLPVGR